MRTPSDGRTSNGGEQDRTPAGKAVARREAESSSPQGTAGLPPGAGNAAAIQLLRMAGHPWAQELHQHNAGCGHGQTEQAAPSVQRSAVHDVLRAPGRSLDEATRTDMESRLGADFSDVRIHDDSAARTSAAEVGARAYTSGNHVVIGDGGNDKHTLAHELTHVIQQRQGPVAGSDTGSGLRVSDPSDRFEREAEATANRVMAGARPEAAHAVQRDAAPSPVASGTPSVQRVEYPTTADDMLTQRYWEQQAGGAKELQKARKGMKGIVKVKPRPIDAIVGGIANSLLVQLDAKPATSGSMTLYRGMSSGEADRVLEWAQGAEGVVSEKAATEAWIRENPKATAEEWHDSGHPYIPVGTHLGDQKQAHNYMEDGSRMLAFTLKPGAHELLFNPLYTALAPQGDAPTYINHAYPPGAKDPQRVAASANEGTLGGYIGIKAEQHGYFSVNPGKSSQRNGEWQQTPGHLLFQLFLHEVREVTEYDAASLPSTRRPK
ncbi:DUF4157 domain-containing protein [Streptomyces sp. NPDC050842]|uniref:DUF4157 domain-containing protein n=1 Tax=Streptomyces sp. NPDC050842 TaxID=3365636 RepID=UPI00378A3AEA